MSCKNPLKHRHTKYMKIYFSTQKKYITVLIIHSFKTFKQYPYHPTRMVYDQLIINLYHLYYVDLDFFNCCNCAFLFRVFAYGFSRNKIALFLKGFFFTPRLRCFVAATLAMIVLVISWQANCLNISD